LIFDGIFHSLTFELKYILWCAYDLIINSLKNYFLLYNNDHFFCFSVYGQFKRILAVRPRATLQNVIGSDSMASSITWPPFFPSNTTSSPNSIGFPFSDWRSLFSGQNHTSKVILITVSSFEAYSCNLLLSILSWDSYLFFENIKMTFKM
jgi:hypothetical protein